MKVLKGTWEATDASQGVQKHRLQYLDRWGLSAMSALILGAYSRCAQYKAFLNGSYISASFYATAFWPHFRRRSLPILIANILSLPVVCQRRFSEAIFFYNQCRVHDKLHLLAARMLGLTLDTLLAPNDRQPASGTERPSTQFSCNILILLGRIRGHLRLPLRWPRREGFWRGLCPWLGITPTPISPNLQTASKERSNVWTLLKVVPSTVVRPECRRLTFSKFGRILVINVFSKAELKRANIDSLFGRMRRFTRRCTYLMDETGGLNLKL